MVFSSLAAAMLTGFLATGSIPAQPAWQTDYSKALAKSIELKKPVAVFIALGGSDKLVTDGLGDDAAKLLQSSYVCLSIDTSTAAGKDLAKSFKMNEGLVISDKSGGLQALRHEGTVSRTDLNSYLTRFSTVSTVTTTENRSNAPVAAPTFGGCANGRCGTPIVYPSFSGGCANGRCGY